MISYDYFVFVKNRHKEEVGKIVKKAVKDKSYKLLDDCKVKLKKKIEKDLSNVLSNIAKESVKTHLLFKELEYMKDSSWKSIMFNLYNCKLSDFNNDINKKLEYFSRLLKDENLSKFTLEKISHFDLKLESPFFTASENKFYSINNPIAKERPTGIPIFKGGSLKGALRQAAVDVVEEELLDKNYGSFFEQYVEKEEDEIIKEEEKGDRFFFKKRARLVRLFGNEKNAVWFTFKSLLATGGIKDAGKVRGVLQKITGAFECYLRSKRIVNSEGSRKGRLIFEDLHFSKIGLDVITPLDRVKRTPKRGPIFYEVVPKGAAVAVRIIWFPFDLIAEGKSIKEIEEEWKADERVIKRAFERLKGMGIGAKTKNGWGKFSEEENNGTERLD